MKRIRIVGLCLVAAFAFAAIASASASAQTVEYGQCLAKKKGNYNDGACASSNPKKGKFEWYAGKPNTCIAKKKGNYNDPACTVLKPKKGKFEKEPGAKFTTSSGPGSLESPVLSGPVTCKKSTGKGEITGVNTGVVSTLFEECESSLEKCTSSGQSTGNILTPPNHIELIANPEKRFDFYNSTNVGPTVGHAWAIFTPEPPAKYSGEFACGVAGEVRTFNEVGGETSAVNTMSNTGKTEFALGVGLDSLKTESNVGLGWSGEAHSILDNVSTTTYEAKVEERIH
jgi:hypothetical protein